MAACLLCRREVTICASCVASIRGRDCALNDEDDDWSADAPPSPEFLAAMRTIDEMFKP